MILGDNIFHGKNFVSILDAAKNRLLNKNQCSVFGYQVDNPGDFGVIEFDDNENIISIEEKPLKPKSNYAVVGLYFYTNDVIELVNKIKPSSRGELEITEINNYYIKNKKLDIIKLDDNFSWLDTGTFDSLIKASEYMQKIEHETGIKVACIEELVYDIGLINLQELNIIANSMSQSNYGKYLLNKINCIQNDLY